MPGGRRDPYEQGKYDPAFKLAKRACDARDEDATFCIQMALLQEKGLGTKKDPKAARALFKKYCENESNAFLDSVKDEPICKKSGQKPPAATPKPKPKPKPTGKK